MLEALRGLNPVMQALLAGLLTWGLTAAGAAVVFTQRQASRRTLDAMLGFAGGVMLAASFWSLLQPAIERAEEAGGPGWLPAAIGFVLGGGSIAGADHLLNRLRDNQNDLARKLATRWRRSTLLIGAITLHNIPEGLAVGVAFAAASVGVPGATFGGAAALAVGIALQNFPEGIAVAMPLRREGVSPWKSWMAGQASALVEPAAAVAGAAALLLMQPLLPYALAFAAGAMIFVVVDELVPEYHREHALVGTTGLLVGFTVMMILDVALG